MRGIWTGIVFLLLGLHVQAQDFPRRWFYCPMSFDADENVSWFSNVVRTASASGMNGVMLGGGVEFSSGWPPAHMARLRAAKRLCDDIGVEIVPSIFSFGYGGYGDGRIEGVPVNGVRYHAKDGRAVWAGDADVSELGTECPQVGRGMNRLVRRARVTSASRYRLSCDIRTDGVEADRPIELWALDAARKDFFLQGKRTFHLMSTQDWTTCALDFNVHDDETNVYVYAGYQGGWRKGTVSFRRFRLERIAPASVLSPRPGTPVRLRNARTGEAYVVGRDFACPKFRRPKDCAPEAAVSFELLADGKIREGTELVLDCYEPAVVNGSQVSTCLTEPELYEYVVASVTRVEQVLSPKTWHLTMDEFRNGGTCAACRATGKTMAEIYGTAVTRIFNIIRSVHPGAEIHLWSDMLDPNHNGVECYFNCRGSFADAWRHVPSGPDGLVIDCWYGEKCEQSLAFFSAHGFRTLAAAYYDERPPFANSRRWREAGVKTEGFQGYMYTTWRRNFADLPEFCNLWRTY